MGKERDEKRRMSKLDNNVERRERLKRVRRPHGKEKDPLSISFYYLHFLLAVRARGLRPM